MTFRFSNLTRARVRRLKPGDRITESGITATCLTNGDIRYSVNIMVDGRRVHRVVGKASEGTTRTQAEAFIAQTRSEARQGRLNLPTGRKLHLTFDGAAEVYLKNLRELGAREFYRNEMHLRLHLRPFFADMRLDQISELTLKKYQKHCREKGLSEATINRTLAT